MSQFVETTAQITTTWTVAQVRSALQEHESGVFRNSAQLADHIRRDDRVKATLDTRVLGMLGLPFDMAKNLDGDQRQAGAVAETAKRWWPRQFRKRQLAKILRTGLIMGLAPVELLWSEPSANVWLPRPKIWHPQFLQWNQGSRAYTITTLNKGTIPFTPGDGTWGLFAPGGDEYPWMEGAIRALAIPWLIRSYAWRDWSRASEVYGLGIRKAKVPARAKIEVVRKFFRDVKNLGNEPTIKLPEGFDLDLLMAEAVEGKGFQGLIDKCDSAITLAILGQNLTTSIEGGAYNAASIHARVQLDRLEADAEDLGDFAEEQILSHWARRNYGSAELAPRPSYDATPPEDKQRKANTLQAVSTSVKTLRDAGLISVNEARAMVGDAMDMELVKLEGGDKSPLDEPKPKPPAPPAPPALGAEGPPPPNPPPAPERDRNAA